MKILAIVGIIALIKIGLDIFNLIMNYLWRKQFPHWYQQENPVEETPYWARR